MADGRRQAVPEYSQVPRMRSAMEVATEMTRGTSFDAMLFRLMQKADNRNFRKLAKAFPDQAREYVNWFGGEREGTENG